MEALNGLNEKALELVWNFGPKLLLALITLVVGLWGIRLATSLISYAFEKRGLEVSLRHFLAGFISVGLKAMLVISVAGMVGIETTSFIAVLGAAGLAVGLALQGSLANFAGGVLILLFRPFKVGDFIQAMGESGTVKQIQVFSTVLTTGDNKRVIIPNGPLASSTIINVSAEETRRVDFVFGIGYEDDIKKAKSVIEKIASEDERVHKDPAPLVVVSELADSSVNLTARMWVNAADYWGVFFDTQEKVKLAFDESGISIPYPQTEMHLHQAGGSGLAKAG